MTYIDAGRGDPLNPGGPLRNYQELKKLLSYENFCPNGTLIFSDKEAEKHTGKLQAAREGVARLPGSQRQQLLDTLTRQVLNPENFCESVEYRNAKGRPVREELKAKLFIRDLHFIFQGQTSLEDFTSACEVKFTELLTDYESCPVFFDAFEGILPRSFYEQKGVQFLIREHILYTAEAFPLLLPSFNLLPGFKEVFKDLGPDEAQKQDFRETIFALSRNLHISTALLLSDVLDLLQIGDIVEERKFAAAMGKQIGQCLKEGAVIDALNWLSLLPRDPDNNLEFTDASQKIISSHELHAYGLIEEALENDELESKDLPGIVYAIRNFISKDNRDSYEYYQLIKSASIKILEDDGQIDRVKPLIKTLPDAYIEDLLNDAELRCLLHEVVSRDIRSFNHELETFTGQDLASKSRLFRYHGAFKRAVRFFKFNSKRIMDLPEELSEELSCYHYISDICADRQPPTYKVKPEVVFVNKGSWLRMVERAHQLFEQDKFYQSEQYSKCAVASMIKVPGIAREASVIAGLFTLLANLEMDEAKSSNWSNKARYLQAGIKESALSPGPLQ